MRTHHINSTQKLYRSVNTTTRHRSNNPGAEYRWKRNANKLTNELLPQRESMHGSIVSPVKYKDKVIYGVTRKDDSEWCGLRPL